MSTHEMTQLTETLEEHGRVLKKISEDQRDMMQLLQGNRMNPSDKGLLGRIEVTEQKVNTLETQRDRAVWTVGGVVFVVGIIYSIIELLK